MSVPHVVQPWHLQDVTWVLGASDPEMEMIEHILRTVDQRVIHATTPDGRRVRPETAYQAVPVECHYQRGHRLILVECGWPDQPDNSMVVDHHRPGDPGYGRSPEEFLPASSIGQVIRLAIIAGHGEKYFGPVDSCGITSTPGHFARYHKSDGWYLGAGNMPSFAGFGWRVPEHIVMVAAADHCLTHAYAGRCPGVDPDALMMWRAESRAAFLRRPIEAVMADIQSAMDAIAAAPRLRIAGRDVADMGDRHIPELPEAASRLGVPFLATGLPDPAGRRKQVLQSAPADVIATWMAEHPGSYGDPARGFAGRYFDHLPPPPEMERYR